MALCASSLRAPFQLALAQRTWTACTCCSRGKEAKWQPTALSWGSAWRAEPRNKQESARLTLLTQETICFWGLPQENDTVLSQPAISTTSTAPYPVWSLSSVSQLRWNEVVSAVMSRLNSINYHSYNRMDNVDLKTMLKISNLDRYLVIKLFQNEPRLSKSLMIFSLISITVHHCMMYACMAPHWYSIFSQW